MDVGRRIADAYREDGPSAIALAGSVGAGLADEWSDLEIDCYWDRPPTDDDRRAPVADLGGAFTEFWAYDADDHEWSEDYLLDGLPVTVSNFTTADIAGVLDDVTLEADVDPVKHMRLAAISRCIPLRGEQLLDSWSARGARYPDALVVSMIERALDASVLRGWSVREALVSRGDRVALHALLSRVETAVVTSLLAVNRTYQPHSTLKWQRDLLAGLAITPEQLEERLDRMWTETDPSLPGVELLLRDVAGIVADQSNADIDDFLEELSERRRWIQPPR